MDRLSRTSGLADIFYSFNSSIVVFASFWPVYGSNILLIFSVVFGNMLYCFYRCHLHS